MKFNNFLGFFLEGFEGEFLSMLQKIKKKKKEHAKRKGVGSTSRFDQELKKLEWSMNYKGGD